MGESRQPGDEERQKSAPDGLDDPLHFGVHSLFIRFSTPASTSRVASCSAWWGQYSSGLGCVVSAVGPPDDPFHPLFRHGVAPVDRPEQRSADRAIRVGVAPGIVTLLNGGARKLA